MCFFCILKPKSNRVAACALLRALGQNGAFAECKPEAVPVPDVNAELPTLIVGQMLSEFVLVTHLPHERLSLVIHPLPPSSGLKNSAAYRTPRQEVDFNQKEIKRVTQKRKKKVILPIARGIDVRHRSRKQQPKTKINRPGFDESTYLYHNDETEALSEDVGPWKARRSGQCPSPSVQRYAGGRYARPRSFAL
jgi:hypothetical protein